MEFNFYDQYKSYSNFELLKILQQPEHYQPSAVEAATLILKEREVSEQEQVEVADHFEAIQQKEQVKQARVNFVRNKLVSFFEPMVKSPDEVHPVKWLNFLLVITAYQYLADIFARIKTGIFLPLTLYTNGGLPYYIMALLDVLSLVYVPFFFYLLYKKNRWGWIILFADTTFSLLAQLSQVYLLFRYLSVHHANVPVYFVSMAFRGFLLYFLWRHRITEFFGVSAKNKRDTALMSFIGSPILIAFIYVLSNDLL